MIIGGPTATATATATTQIHLRSIRLRSAVRLTRSSIFNAHRRDLCFLVTAFFSVVITQSLNHPITRSPDHPITDQLRKNHGKEERRARDLFYGLWIPDLFMRRVEADESWSLMCPDECPGLLDVHGEAFDRLYERYEAEGRAMRVVRARTLWRAILDAQIETGTPYMLYKDHCNAKSNQQHLGTVRSSNLCCEIIEYTSPDEIAVCNLASLVLPRYVVGTHMHDDDDVDANSDRVVPPHPPRTAAGDAPLDAHLDAPTTGHASGSGAVREGYRAPSEGGLWHHPLELNPSAHPATEAEADATSTSTSTSTKASSGMSRSIYFDHNRLYEVTKVACRNLNRVIDLNHYPVPEARNSNMRHRPIGLGVQGLADVFIQMRMPFDSAPARQLNKEIFETIYFAALDASCELAEKDGAHESFAGSPASFGKLQPDLWGIDSEDEKSSRWDWAWLRARIIKSGLRNSLLVAPMPTASTAQVRESVRGVRAALSR